MLNLSRANGPISILLVSLLASSAGEASTPIDALAPLTAYCLQESASSCGIGRPSSVLETMSQTCQIEQETICKDYFGKSKEDPNVVGKKCGKADICADHHLEIYLETLGCGKGFTGVLVETLEGYWSLATAAGSQLRGHSRTLAEFAQDIAPDIDALREFTADIPEFDRLSDPQLLKLAREKPDHILKTRKDTDDLREKVRKKNRIDLYFKKTTDQKSEIDEIIADRRHKTRKRLLAQSKEWLTNQGVRLRCYNTQARAELLCYAAFSILDPTGAAAYPLKVAKANKFAQKMNSGLQTEALVGRRHGDADFGPAPMRSVDGKPLRNPRRQSLVSQYMHKDLTTEKQNREWMAFVDEVHAKAEKGHLPSDNLFIDIENSKLKELNDTLQDKDLVTSLNNVYKEIIHGKMTRLMEKYPNKVLTYSDFKSLRYAVVGEVPKAFKDELSKIYREANSEFQKTVTSVALLRESDPPPQGWFRVGIGRSADQATAGSRFARRDKDSSVMLRDFNSASVRASFYETLKETQTLHKTLTSKIGDTTLMTADSSGRKLSHATWELLRKAKSPEDLSQKVKNRFGLNLDQATAAEMMNYASKIDVFSPGLHIAKRKVVNLDKADHGGFTVDFRGMGAFNAVATESAVINAKNLDDALVLARNGEKLVTSKFSEIKEKFSKAVHKVLGHGYTLLSGDDAAAIPTANRMTLIKQEELLKELTKDPDTAKIRLSQINPRVPRETRTLLSVHGESIDKTMRTDLEAFIPFETLDKLTFAVHMNTRRLDHGSVNLIVGHQPGVKLTKEMEAYIDQSFQKSIRVLRTEIQDDGRTTTYRAGRVAFQ